MVKRGYGGLGLRGRDIPPDWCCDGLDMRGRDIPPGLSSFRKIGYGGLGLCGDAEALFDGPGEPLFDGPGLCVRE